MAFDLERVRAALPGRRIEHHAVVGSTMTEAAALGEAGAVVVADQQTAGIGRYNRPWHSAPGDGLYFTVVLGIAPAPVATLAIGLAVKEALSETVGIAADIRWPNDILIGDRKLCGILTQLHDGRMLAGIGVNVNHAEFPPELAGVATSLLMETGRRQEREGLLIAILERLDAFLALPQPELLRAFTEQSSYARGRRVSVELNGREVRGVTAGLDENGYLLVDEDTGRRHTILAGGVRPCS